MAMPPVRRTVATTGASDADMVLSLQATVLDMKGAASACVIESVYLTVIYFF
jgi:hypothetical protein